MFWQRHTRLSWWVAQSLSASRYPMAFWLYWEISRGHIWWLLIIGPVAQATDLVDGGIAKKAKVTSQFGYHFDAISDKLLMTAIAAGLFRAGDLPFLVFLGIVILLFQSEGMLTDTEIPRILAWTICEALVVFALLVQATGWVLVVGLAFDAIRMLAVPLSKQDEFHRVLGEVRQRLPV